VWSSLLVWKAVTTSSRPAQMRETSDLETPESIPSAADQSSMGAGGHASDVEPPSPWLTTPGRYAGEFEDQREERTLAQLRDSQVDVAGLRGQHPAERTVALVGAGLGPLVTGGTDELGGFGLDGSHIHEAAPATLNPHH
jgi:hypothetical protein